MSPPSRWSGLKFHAIDYHVDDALVSTLAVEWIEITSGNRYDYYNWVSTLAVEWIEIKQ